jgi:hypothetical protein
MNVFFQVFTNSLPYTKSLSIMSSESMHKFFNSSKLPSSTYLMTKLNILKGENRYASQALGVSRGQLKLSVPELLSQRASLLFPESLCLHESKSSYFLAKKKAPLMCTKLKCQYIVKINGNEQY